MIKYRLKRYKLKKSDPFILYEDWKVQRKEMFPCTHNTIDRYQSVFYMTEEDKTLLTMKYSNLDMFIKELHD